MIKVDMNLHERILRQEFKKGELGDLSQMKTREDALGCIQFPQDEEPQSLGGEFCDGILFNHYPSKKI